MKGAYWALPYAPVKLKVEVAAVPCTLGLKILAPGYIIKSIGYMVVIGAEVSLSILTITAAGPVTQKGVM